MCNLSLLAVTPNSTLYLSLACRLPASTRERKHRMNRKFGGGKPAVGTPSLAWSCVVVVASLLAGASIVHNIYKPDLTLPPVDDALSKQSEAKQN
ncbi:hypothetical protein AKJ16_DCAP11888 [Drosera capensis]